MGSEPRCLKGTNQGSNEVRVKSGGFIPIWIYGGVNSSCLYHCSLHISHCKTSHCTQKTSSLTQCTAYWTPHITHYTLHTAYRTPHTAHCADCSVKQTEHRSSWTSEFTFVLPGNMWSNFFWHNCCIWPTQLIVRK